MYLRLVRDFCLPLYPQSKESRSCLGVGIMLQRYIDDMKSEKTDFTVSYPMALTSLLRFNKTKNALLQCLQDITKGHKKSTSKPLRLQRAKRSIKY